MAVYYAPQRTPWWAGPLGQLVTGQIDAMMGRTNEARKAESQQKFAGALSQLAQENPDLTSEQLFAQGMGLPGFHQSGDTGMKVLDQISKGRAKELAERNLFSSVGGDDSGIMNFARQAVYMKELGLPIEAFMERQMPKLDKREFDLGDRYVGQSVDPYSGKVKGDEFNQAIGVSPDTRATVAQRADEARMKNALGWAAIKRRPGTLGELTDPELFKLYGESAKNDPLGDSPALGALTEEVARRQLLATGSFTNDTLAIAKRNGITYQQLLEKFNNGN